MISADVSSDYIFISWWIPDDCRHEPYRYLIETLYEQVIENIVLGSDQVLIIYRKQIQNWRWHE